MAGCTDSSEEPVSDFKLPIQQRSSVEITRKAAEIAQQLGFRIETNDPSQMATLNGGHEAVSVWLFNGEKHVGNILTFNEGGNIRIMLFKSGLSTQHKIENLEMVIKDAFEYSLNDK